MRRKIIIALIVAGLFLIVLAFALPNSSDKEQTSDSTKVSETTKPVDKPLSATEALKTVVGDNTISGAKYFANDTWLVGTTSSNGTGEVFIVVAKYSGGEWATVDVGSFIDTELLLLDSAPPDVIAYLEEVQ